MEDRIRHGSTVHSTKSHTLVVDNEEVPGIFSGHSVFTVGKHGVFLQWYLLFKTFMKLIYYCPIYNSLPQSKLICMQKTDPNRLFLKFKFHTLLTIFIFIFSLKKSPLIIDHHFQSLVLGFLGLVFLGGVFECRLDVGPEWAYFWFQVWA